jgi:hypothetical protein
VVDDHVHVVFASDRPRLYERGLVRVLRHLLPERPLLPPHLRSVESRTHHERLLAYLLRQPEKHGLATPPALWEGSCFLDLVGARLLPRYELGSLRRALPRARLRQLMGHVGLPARRVEPAGDDLVHAAGPAGIARLAAGVYAVPPDMHGNRPERVAARTLAGRTCREVGYPLASLEPCLQATPRTLRRLAQGTLLPRPRAAFRRWLSLEASCAALARFTQDGRRTA